MMVKSNFILIYSQKRFLNYYQVLFGLSFSCFCRIKFCDIWILQIFQIHTIPFPDQFGTSGSQIGGAQTQFNKNKTEYDKMRNRLVKFILYFVISSFIFSKLSLSSSNFTSIYPKLFLKRYRF